ncbi:MAG: hypothetical protein LBE22_01075 [Azoarcus sp.]|jgi:hypothetical protein|nr:hypothetical protein [Azoarcus sp.]
MKRFVLNVTLSCLAASLLTSGCVSEPEFHDQSLLWARFSMKNGVPCFAARDEQKLLQSSAKIHAVTVFQSTDSNEGVSFLWMIRWQDPIRLAQGECIEYGSNAGHKTYVYPKENCTDPRLKPVHGDYKLLPSGECGGEDEAKKLEKGVVYFVGMDALVDSSREDGEGFYIRDFFCLADGKNGETVIHRLKFDPINNAVETCPGAKTVP